MPTISLTISRAIKSGKWLSISYRNANDEITKFWIAVLDIQTETRRLSVLAFNDNLASEVQEYPSISYDNILSAQVIEGTYYEQHRDVIEKIETSPLTFAWLNYFEVSDQVLSYYEKCYEQDVSLSERNFLLLEGFDEYQFVSSEYHLSEEHRKQVLRTLKRNTIQKEEEERPVYERFALNFLSLQDKKDRKIPLIYKDLYFDIKENTFRLNNGYKYVASYQTDDYTLVLRNYIPYDENELINLFQTNREEAVQLVMQSLQRGEIVSEVPYVMIFKEQVHVPISLEYQSIRDQFLNDELSRPLSVFFGRFSKINRRRKRDLPIVVIDAKVNIEQIRAIYHAVNQDITYVQGPPGTGKTTLIRNVIISSLFNDRKILVSSNNNEAINNIRRLLKEFRYTFNGVEREVPLPILRLGNLEYAEEALRLMGELLNISLSHPFDEQLLDQSRINILSSIEPVKELLDDFEDKMEALERREVLQTLLKNNEGKMHSVIIDTQLQEVENEIQLHESLNEYKLIRRIVSANQTEKVMEYLYHESIKRLQLLSKPSFAKLRAIIESASPTRLRSFLEYIGDDDQLNDLLKVFPIVVSTNLGVRRLGSPKVHFDLLIMDEAGQCNVATSLLPMSRCDRALFVGDTSQLQPISQLNDSTNTQLMKEYDISQIYSYKDNSILKLLQQIDTRSLFILLRNHYRSDRKIVGFSNKKYYGGQLFVKTPDQPNPLVFMNVKSKIRGIDKNTSPDEVSVILNDIKQNNYKNVGIITPFRNQAELIEEQIRDQNLDTNIKAGTIHTFQGNEREVIYLSLAVTDYTSPRAMEWLKMNSELINVATTRAQKKLIMVSDDEVLRKHLDKSESDLNDLLKYIKTQGTCEVKASPGSFMSSRVIGAKVLNSQFEKDFLETISHYLGIRGHIKAKEKVKITDILMIEPVAPYFKYANSAHLDVVLFNEQDEPILAFEINGDEHRSNKQVQLRDQQKKMILEKHRLQLVTIPNNYVRRYDYLRNVLIQLLGD